MNVYWLDTEKTILIHELPDTWEWSDYNNAVRKLRQLLHEIEHDVCIIIDARYVDLLPKGCMIYFNECHQNLPSHVAMRILVSRKRAMRSVTSLLIKVMPSNFQNFFCASTLEEAHKLINEARKKPVEEVEGACV
jgi:hypothetical protein